MKRLACVCLLGVCGAAMGQTGTTVQGMLQPAIRDVAQAVSGLQPDKWKLSGPLKQQTTTDLGSIERDLTATLPGLVTTADAAPGSASAALPVASNVDALYDVMLRVAERAAVGAPDAQTQAVGQALQELADARKALNARISANVAATEKQVHDLRANVKTQTDAAAAAQAQISTLQAAAAKPCPPVKPAVRRTTTKKPASTTTAKPAGSASGTAATKPQGF